MKLHQSSPEPSVNFSDASCVKYLSKSSFISPLLSGIDLAVSNSALYQKINVSDFVPVDKRQKYNFIPEIEKGLSSPVFFFTYSHGSNVEDACSSENLRLVEQIKKETVPIFHTRMMKQEFYNIYGRISPQSQPYILRSIYHALTNDQSTARTTAEKEIDQRVADALRMEDPDIIVDLRELNTNGKDCFTIFWEKRAEFLSALLFMSEGMARQHSWLKQFRFVI